MGKTLDTKEGCLSYLEKVRWGKTIKCPYCLSEKTHPSKNEQGRHFCYNCVRSFSVLVGTIFEDTRLELPVWFEIIHAMLKNKSGLSAKRISSQFGITLKTAWLTAMKIRCAMIDRDTKFHGLLHSDENCLVAKDKRSKKLNKYDVGKAISLKGDKPNLSVIEEITPMRLLGILKHYKKADESPVMKKGLRSYATMDETIEEISYNHAEKNKDKAALTSVEDYWEEIKAGMRGNYKALSDKYLPFYLVEYEYKQKRRNKRSGLFSEFIKTAISNNAHTQHHLFTKIKKEFTYG
jgi:transposase-like protein